MRNIGLIMGKEIKELLRNKRTLFVVFVLPVLLYPILIIGFGQLMIHQMMEIEKDIFTVAYRGDDHLKSLFEADSQLVIIPWHPTSDSSLISGDIEAIVQSSEFASDSIAKGGRSGVDIFFDGSDEKSRAALTRLQGIVGGWEDSIVAERLLAEGYEKDFIDPIRTNSENRASAKKMGGAIFGPMLAFILIAMVITGAYNGAVDMFAGERERGTLETLMVSPVGRLDIVMGKYLTVLLLALITALLNLGSMGLTLTLSVGNVANMGEKLPMAFSMGFTEISIFLLALIPNAGLFSALFLLVSAFARDYKEAQSYITPVFMAAYFPAMITMLPGIEMSPIMAIVPVLNTSLLFKEILSGGFDVWHLGLTLLSTTAYAGMVVWWASKILAREEIFLSDEKMSFFSYLFAKKPDSSGKGKIDLGIGILLFIVTVILLQFVGGPWQAEDMLSGLLKTEILLVLLPVALVIRFMKVKKSELNIGKPSLHVILLTIVTAFAAFIFVQQLSIWLSQIIDVPLYYTEAMGKFIEELAGVNFWYALFVIAVLPAIAEELLFRGYILRGAVRTIGVTGGIILTGILFGLFHIDPYRLFATAFLGIFLSAIGYRHGLLIAMLAHFVNNALALSWAINPTVHNFLSPEILNGEFPLWVFVLAGGIFIGGFYVLMRQVKPFLNPHNSTDSGE